MGQGIANAGTVAAGQMTPAMQVLRQLLSKPSASGARRRKRKPAKSARSTPKRRKARASGKKKRAARLVRGSAAAKRYMAKIRRMRKRK